MRRSAFRLYPFVALLTGPGCGDSGGDDAGGSTSGVLTTSGPMASTGSTGGGTTSGTSGGTGDSGATTVVIDTDSAGTTGTGGRPLAEVAMGVGGYPLEGEAPFNRSGTALAAAGDIDGDGIGDLIVGAPVFALYTGRAYVVFGTGGSSPVQLADIDAAVGGGFSLRGESQQDRTGTAVAGAGDVNGDGIDDVVVGAPAAGAGRAYVVFGKSDFNPVDLANLVGGGSPAGFVIQSAPAIQQTGAAVAGIGDVNGDMLDDLIIGAPGAVGAGVGSGAGYVVFGKADSDTVALGTLQGDGNGFRIIGPIAGAHAGASVAGAGDVNGDTIPDVVLGAPDEMPGGAAYVVFGKADTATVDLAMVGIGGGGGFVMRGVSTDDAVGTAVAGVGDIDGDNRADVAIGAPGANPMGDNAGATYIVFGKTTASPVDLGVLDGTDGLTINGAGAGDASGSSLAAAGDIDGDSVPDLVIGAPGAEPRGSYSGRAYIVFGTTAAATIQLGAVANGFGGFSYFGEDEFQFAGTAVTAMGDINGDAVGDLAIGAPGVDANGAYSGRTYVVFGDP